MKKIFFSTVLIILALLLCFLLFSSDENSINKRFLLKYNIEVKEKPYLIEEFKIPIYFDEFYESYNVLQIESGLNLSPYKGKEAVRYSYEMNNFPDDAVGSVFANVITVNSKPVAGDINCPSLSGFILPLSHLLSHK